MKVTRRQFIIGSGATVAAVALGLPKLEWARAEEFAKLAKLKSARETTTICPYCAVGCGLVVATDVAADKVINMEGYSEHPINEGALCSKGGAIRQIPHNDQRLSKVLYRKPKSDKWEEISWEKAIDMITDRIIKTRNETFVARNSKGVLVNRTEGIASLGGAALDNEECYALVKMLRSLGLVYIEHQARI